MKVNKVMPGHRNQIVLLRQAGRLGRRSPRLLDSVGQLYSGYTRRRRPRKSYLWLRTPSQGMKKLGYYRWSPIPV